MGSILLVGITVVMAAAFGAVLMAYDGPSNQVHAQLAVSVGPGADGDWGTNDAELRLQHLGGEALPDNDVTVRYLVPGGTLQTVQPVFTGGELQVGDVWTQTISAQQGDAVQVDVVVTSGSGQALLSTGTASAGSSAAVLTYVTAITATAGYGSVADVANARAANDALDAILQEGSASGGTPTVSTRSPASATDSGAVNPSNILSSNDARATLDIATDYVQGNGYTSTPGGVVVSDISIGFEGRGTTTCSSIAHQATFTGTASGGTTVSSASVSVGLGHTYVVAVATGDDVNPAPDVTGVSGLAGITWSQVEQVSNAAGTSRLEVWVGTGTAVAGVVTATFAGTIDNAAITVSSYSNLDTSSPIQASTTGTATGTALTTGAIAGTATSGRFFLAVNAVTAGTSTPTDFNTPADSGQRSNLDAGNEVQLDVADGAASASNAGSADLSASVPWQAVAATLKPSCPALPSVQLSYLLSGSASGTPQTFALTAVDAATYTISIVADRSWTVGDIANLGVRVTLPTTTAGSTAEIDHVFVTLTTSDVPTAYRSEFFLDFDGVAAGAATETVQLRYRTNGADSFTTAVWTGTAWRACPGLLNAIIYEVFSCALVLPGEHQGSNPNVRMRIQDSTPSGTARATFSLDYARVAAS